MKSFTIHSKSIEGLLEETCAVRVTDDGVFHVVIPDHLEAFGCAILKENKDVPYGTNVVRNTRGNHHFELVGKDLAYLRDLAQQCLDQFAEPQESRELVIIYNSELHAAFAVSKDGATIYPNKSLAEHLGDKTSSWCLDELYGSHDALNPAKGGYSLTFGARIFWKVTVRRGLITRLKYEAWDPREDEQRDYKNPSVGAKLNAFISFDLFPDVDEERGGGVDEDWMRFYPTIHEIPYSDDAAEFFYNMMTGMCRLALSISTYLNVDAKTLVANIENKKSLLLLAAPSKVTK